MALYQRSCLCGCVSVQGERLRGRVGAWDVAGPTVCLRRAPCQACPPIAACICSARVERIVASTQRVKRPARLRTPGSGGCFGHVVNHKEKRQPGGRAGRGFHGTEIRLHGDRAARYPSSHQAQQRHVFVSLVIRFWSLSAAFRIQSPIFILRHRR